MLVIPALDLMGGKCVRLYKGEFDRSIDYSDDPVEVAKRWERAGAEWLHVVDLDGARTGQPVHLKVVQEIKRQTALKVEFGGGLRTFATVDAAAQRADRVVLGTAAVENRPLLEAAVAQFGSEIAVGIDARHGRVAVRGWESDTSIAAVDVAEDARRLGVKVVIFTDINTDGTLEGPNLQAIQAMRAIEGLELIASGGVATLDHLRLLESAGVDGCIVGKAIYEGTLDLKQALQELSKAGRPHSQASS